MPTRCPFCASSAIEPIEIKASERYAYGCQDCGATGPVEESEDQARLSWDRRIDGEGFITLPRRVLGVQP
jgi:Lar family restriction alleviation protein